MIHLAAMAGIALIALVGCDPDEPGCADVSTDCSPLFEPDFDAIFTRVLEPTCAVSGGACHSVDAKRGELYYEDADQSYELLLGMTDARARVIPGDPSCSTLMIRLESSSAARAMPPGAPLSSAERCAIAQWIQNGAPR